jgi:hypothetical protein
VSARDRRTTPGGSEVLLGQGGAALRAAGLGSSGSPGIDFYVAFDGALDGVAQSATEATLVDQRAGRVSPFPERPRETADCSSVSRSDSGVL